MYCTALCCTVLYCTVQKKSINKQAHITNGNHNITVINWNKGAAKLMNRTNHIQNIINIHSPHILAIHELNFQKDHELADVLINGYKGEMDKLLLKNG